MYVECMIYEWTAVDKTTILGYGLDACNAPVVLRIHDFLLHCYTSATTLDRLRYAKCERVKRRLLRDPASGPKNYYKVYFYDSQARQRFCKAVPGKVYEADINIIDAFTSHADIDRCGWIGADCDAVAAQYKISTVAREYIASWTRVRRLLKEDVPRPTIMSVDIECYSARKTSMPDRYANSDVIFMISVAVKRYLDDGDAAQYLLVNLGGYKSPSAERFTLDAPVTIRWYADESALIFGYFDLINEIDPDVITGYNIFGFDFGYLLTRLRRELYAFPNTSRRINGATLCKELKWESAAYGYNDITLMVSEGRTLIDVHFFIKNEYRLKQYGLSYISKEFLNMSKIDLSYKDMFALYEQKDLKRIAEYAVRDAVLPLLLIEKLHIWVSVVEMAKIMRTDIVDLYTRGQQIRIKAQLYKECVDNQYIFNKARLDDGVSAYQGAYVVTPTEGLYRWCSVLDFTSLYPSIIISNNICYTTYDPDGHADCHEVHVDGKVHRFRKSPAGLVPMLLQKLLHERAATKKKLKAASDPQTKAIFDKRQYAYKIAANSIYGAYGASNSPYLHFVQAAESTTALGRQFIQRAIQFIEDTYAVSVIYGDTDSCMLHFGAEIYMNGAARAQLDALSCEIAAQTSAIFPPPVRLEFENMYATVLLLTKKRYIAMTANTHDIIYKGVAIARRDSCDFLKTIYSTVINRIMFDAQYEEVKEMLKQQLMSLLAGHIDVSDLTIRKKIGHRYTNDTHPLYVFQQRINAEPGEMVEYVFCKVPSAYQGEKMCLVQELDVASELDYMYYIEKQIMNPIDELLRVAYKAEFVSMFFHSIKRLAHMDRAVARSFAMDPRVAAFLGFPEQQSLPSGRAPGSFFGLSQS